jgi:hypothetical protein
VELIATLPPYVAHRQAIAAHPRVDALRFNTVNPLAASPREVLRDLLEVCAPKPLWLDLKARQLRIAKFAYLPLAFVELTHAIEVETPAEVWFGDARAVIREVVDGTKLILDERPPRVVGEGEPVNVLHPSLRVKGFLTARDRDYVAAARDLGLRRFMLSFVESAADLDELWALAPDAEIMCKIESRRGLDFVERDYPALRSRGVRLMAARDDLCVHLQDDPWAALPALERIAAADPTAVAASRLLKSLEEDERPALADLADLELLRRMGYRSFMLSDGLCFRRQAWERAAPLLQAWGERWR